MTGVMFADYYFVRHRKLKLKSLYEMSDSSVYWYSHGINWRALVSWAMGVWLVLPGFVQRVHNPTVDMGAWSKMYYLAVNFILSASFQ